MFLEEIDEEVKTILEQAKILSGSSYDMEILEEVSLADFSRLSKSAESILTSVRDIMFINSRKYQRTTELDEYKKFFADNKLDSNIRVMTYPSIMKSIQFKLNSPALMNFVKESIVRYSERGEEIDVEDVRTRSMSYMFKSLTGVALRSVHMSRRAFIDELNGIVKGDGKIFVKVHPLKIIRYATMIPSVISYIDTGLLTQQIKTFSVFAKDYAKKMEKIAANYPEDFNLGREVTKYKQILENAVYDMIFIYRTIRNLLIDINDEYYRVLKFLKTTYGRSSAMNEHAKILATIDSLIESVEEIDMLQGEHQVGLLTEGAITDALTRFKEKVATSVKTIGDDIDRVKKRNSGFRSRNKQIKALLSKIRREKLVVTESMTLYSGTFDNMRVRYPNEVGAANNLGWAKNIEGALKNPDAYRRTAMKNYSSEAQQEYSKEYINKQKHMALLSYCDYVALKSETMTVELAKTYLKSFYLGERVTKVPDIRKIYANLIEYSNVFLKLDKLAYYKVYDQYKKVGAMAEDVLGSGSVTGKELSMLLSEFKELISFELSVIEEHHDCIIKLADESYNVLKKVAEANDSELVLPKLLKESAHGFMLESVDGEEYIPVSELTEDDVTTDLSDLPQNVTIVTPVDDDTDEIEVDTVSGELEISSDELDEIPEPDTIDPCDPETADATCNQVVQMIESVMLMASNGAIVSPSILVESAGPNGLTEYAPIFESVQLILEATGESTAPGFIAKIKTAVSSILENIKKANTWQKIKSIGTAIKGMFVNIRAKIQLAENAGKAEDASKLKVVLGKLASVVTALEHAGGKIGAAPEKLREMTNELLFEMEWRKAAHQLKKQTK